MKKILTDSVAWLKYKWGKLLIFAMTVMVVDIVVHCATYPKELFEGHIFDTEFNIFTVAGIVSNLIMFFVIKMLVDNDLRNMRKQGLITLLIVSLVSLSIPETRAQGFLDGNIFEVPSHSMVSSPDETYPEIEDPPQKVGLAIGVAVLVIAAVAVYYFWDFCQRKFPKTPPSKDDPISFGGSGDSNDYAISATYSSYGSCRYDDSRIIRAASEPRDMHVYELSGMIRASSEGPQFVVSGLKKTTGANPEEMIQDIEGFKSDLARHGIAMDDYSTGRPHYGKNGRPSTSEEVPLSFDYDTKTVTIHNGQPTYSIVIERTDDLNGGVWKTMIKTRVPAGQQIKIVDVSDSPQTFYRLRPL